MIWKTPVLHLFFHFFKMPMFLYHMPLQSFSSIFGRVFITFATFNVIWIAKGREVTNIINLHLQPPGIVCYILFFHVKKFANPAYFFWHSFSFTSHVVRITNSASNTKNVAWKRILKMIGMGNINPNTSGFPKFFTC